MAKKDALKPMRVLARLNNVETSPENSSFDIFLPWRSIRIGQHVADEFDSIDLARLQSKVPKAKDAILGVWDHLGLDFRIIQPEPKPITPPCAHDLLVEVRLNKHSGIVSTDVVHIEGGEVGLVGRYGGIKLDCWL